MRHVPDGVLRRLEDEPLSVPDRVAEHVAECAHCAARRAEIADDAQRAARWFSTPEVTPDVDAAWARLERELHGRPQEEARRRWKPTPVVRRRWSFPALSLRAGLAIGAVGIVVAGTAAAATLTTIFAPTHVAPVSVSRNDMRAVSAFMGLDGGNSLGGFSTPNGSSKMRFGTVSWSSQAPHPASSLDQAVSDAGFQVTLPAHLPSGVGAVRQFTVQPRVRATVTFDSAASSLAGSTVTVQAGPAVIAQYGGTSTTDVPTLAIATMPRPTASSSGTSLGQIEAFLLAPAWHSSGAGRGDSAARRPAGRRFRSRSQPAPRSARYRSPAGRACCSLTPRMRPPPWSGRTATGCSTWSRESSMRKMS